MGGRSAAGFRDWEEAREDFALMHRARRITLGGHGEEAYGRADEAEEDRRSEKASTARRGADSGGGGVYGFK